MHLEVSIKLCLYLLSKSCSLLDLSLSPLREQPALPTFAVSAPYRPLAVVFLTAISAATHFQWPIKNEEDATSTPRMLATAWEHSVTTAREESGFPHWITPIPLHTKASSPAIVNMPTISKTSPEPL